MTISILFIITGIGALTLTRYSSKEQLELSIGEITAVLRDTRKRSVTEENGTMWNVRFFHGTSTPSTYEVFKGSSYDPGSVVKLYTFRRNVSFGEPSAGASYNISFGAGSGTVPSSKLISMVIPGEKGFVGDITVGRFGQITSRIERDVVGYWHFDETTGTMAYDTSLYGNPGAMNPGAIWEFPDACTAGSCILFDGIAGYLDFGTTVSDAMESAGTVMAWVYRSGTGGGVFSRSAGGAWNDERIVIFFKSDTNVWGWSLADGSANQNQQFPIATFPLNAWTHVALTWDGLTVKTYVNGVLSDAIPQSVTPEVSNIPIRAGWTQGLGNQFFQGRLDEVRLYARALAPTEVWERYSDLR